MASRVKIRLKTSVSSRSSLFLVSSLVIHMIHVVVCQPDNGAASWVVFPAWSKSSDGRGGTASPATDTPRPTSAPGSDASSWTLELNEVTASPGQRDSGSSSSVRAKKRFVMIENTDLAGPGLRVNAGTDLEQHGHLRLQGRAPQGQRQHRPEGGESTDARATRRRCRHFTGRGDGGASSATDVAAVTSCSDGRSTGVLISGGRYYMLQPMENKNSSKKAHTREGRAHRHGNEDPDVPAVDSDESNSIDDAEPHILVLHKDVEDELGHHATTCGLKAAAKYHDMKKGENLVETGSSTKLNRPNTGLFGFPDSRASDEKYTLELAVFTDADFLKYVETRFPGDPLPHVIDVVLSFVNGVQALYNERHLQPPLTLTVVQLDVLSGDPSRRRRDADVGKGNSTSPPSGTAEKLGRSPDGDGSDAERAGMDEPVADDDIMTYLKNFCSWAAKRNPVSSGAAGLLSNEIDAQTTMWDHALLITGRDLSIDGDNAVMGLSWVDGMCTSDHSCSVNEGRSFRSVFVMAHELAHSFGVNHDGDKGSEDCKDDDHIMSESDGPGKTTWSKCSKTALNAGFKKAECLRGTSLPKNDKLSLGVSVPTVDKMETKSFTADEQCAYDHGMTFKAVPEQDDICYDLYCTNGARILRSHPAVEGTVCGKDKVCSLGKCTSSAKVSGASNGDDGAGVTGTWNSLVRDSLWGKITDLLMGKKRRETSDAKSEAGTKKADSETAAADGKPGSGRTAAADDEDGRQHDRTGYGRSPLMWPSSATDLIVPLSGVEWRVRRGHCSKSCGGGVRSVQVTCVVTGTFRDEGGDSNDVDDVGGRAGDEASAVDSALCSDTAPPPVPPNVTVEACNPQPCPRGNWDTRAWGQCFPAIGVQAIQSSESYSEHTIEEHCGAQGIQYRSVVCKAELSKSLEAQTKNPFVEMFVPKIFTRNAKPEKPVSFVLKDSKCASPRPPDRQYCIVRCAGKNRNPLVSTIQNAIGGITELFLPTQGRSFGRLF